ncbi:hypothetical protein C4J95_2212 [Pseudomonas orientalis]|nr:hypothetical protein C4J95_2212 [Pseudomonas orientalis]
MWEGSCSLPQFLLRSGSGFCTGQAFDGAIYRGLGNFQQVPHRQNLCPLGAFQTRFATKRRWRLYAG